MNRRSNIAPSALAHARPQRRRYVAPVLREYGRVHTATRGSYGPVHDAGSTMGKGGMA